MLFKNAILGAIAGLGQIPRPNIALRNPGSAGIPAGGS